MAELVKGVKTGLVTGIVYGGVTTFLITALHAFSESAGIFLIIPMSIPTLMEFAILFFTVWIIGGTIFGVIYTALYDRLPGSGSIAKGVVLAILIWLLIEIVTIYFYLPVFSVALINIRGLVSHAGAILFNFLLSVVGGLMIGALWEEFSR